MFFRRVFPVVALLWLAAGPALGETATQPIEIEQGTVGTVGGSPIGVIAVNGPTGKGTARLSVDLYASNIPVEFTLRLHEGNWLPASDGMHRLEQVKQAAGARRGLVALSANPVDRSATGGSGVAYLAQDGFLRLNGPDTHGASDMVIKAWKADPKAPAVDVQWQPAQFAPEDTDPKTMQNAHLTTGKHLAIGQVTLVVSAIEPETAHHPAWIRFEIARAP